MKTFTLEEIEKMESVLASGLASVSMFRQASHEAMLNTSGAEDPERLAQILGAIALMCLNTSPIEKSGHMFQLEVGLAHLKTLLKTARKEASNATPS